MTFTSFFNQLCQNNMWLWDCLFQSVESNFCSYSRPTFVLAVCDILFLAGIVPLVNQHLEVSDWYFMYHPIVLNLIYLILVFATNALDYQLLSNLKISCGSVTSISSFKHRDLFVDNSHIIAIWSSMARGVNPLHLSKVRSIDLVAAKETIQVTTQLKQQETYDDPSQNFSTND